MAQKDLITWQQVKPDFGSSTYSFAQAGKALDSMTSGLSGLTDRISSMGKDMTDRANAERENVLKQHGEAISNQALLDAVDASGKFHQDRYAASIVKQQEALGINNLNEIDRAKLQASIDGNTTDQIQTNINLSADSREWSKHNYDKDKTYADEIRKLTMNYGEAAIKLQNGEISPEDFQKIDKDYHNGLQRYKGKGLLTDSAIANGYNLTNNLKSGNGETSLYEILQANGVYTPSTQAYENTKQITKQIAASNNRFNESAFLYAAAKGVDKILEQNKDAGITLNANDIAKGLENAKPFRKMLIAIANKSNIDLNTEEGQIWLASSMLDFSEGMSSWKPFGGERTINVDLNKENTDLIKGILNNNVEKAKAFIEKYVDMDFSGKSDSMILGMAYGMLGTDPKIRKQYNIQPSQTLTEAHKQRNTVYQTGNKSVDAVNSSFYDNNFGG